MDHQGEENPDDDEVLALLIQIRDELRAANARAKAPDLPLKAAAAGPTEIAMTPQLEAALSALRQSREELIRAVRDELLNDGNLGSR